MKASEELPKLKEWYEKQEDAKIDEWLMRTVEEVLSLLRRVPLSEPATIKPIEDWKWLLEVTKGGTRLGSITQQYGAKILVQYYWPQRLIAELDELKSRLKLA